MEQKQPIVYSGLFFIFKLLQHEEQSTKKKRNASSPSQPPSVAQWAQTVADDRIVDVKSPCHSQIADVSKLNLASLLKLYYQVYLAFSQILMKSSMHETILILCLLIYISIWLALCVMFEFCCSISRGYMCMYAAHCLNIHGSQCNCKKKKQPKIMDFISLDYHYNFSISFCVFMANSSFQSVFFFFLERTSLVSFTRFLLLNWRSTSYITNLNPFYVCFTRFTEIFIFGIANCVYASPPQPLLVFGFLAVSLCITTHHVRFQCSVKHLIRRFPCFSFCGATGFYFLSVSFSLSLLASGLHFLSTKCGTFYEILRPFKWANTIACETERLKCVTVNGREWPCWLRQQKYSDIVLSRGMEDLI